MGGVNLYGFVGNNPINFVDLLGLSLADDSNNYLDGELFGMQRSISWVSQEIDKGWNWMFDNTTGSVDPTQNPYWYAGQQTARDAALMGLLSAAGGEGAGLEGDTATLTKCASKRPVVIGQNMSGRVEPFAKEWGFDYYKPSKWFDDPNELHADNMKWINDVMDQNRPIYNLGPDPNLPPSNPLQNELNEIYKRSYPINSFEIFNGYGI
jgi:hypothetical protein